MVSIRSSWTLGRLGEGYRESVAKMLPILAPQVVVFVSPTQWKGEVERNLAPRCDKRYLLQYQGKRPPQNLAEVVDLNGSPRTASTSSRSLRRPRSWRSPDEENSTRCYQRGTSSAVL